MGCGLPTKLVKIVRGNTFPCCSSEDCYDSVTGRGWRITKDDCIIAPPAVIPASPNASLDRDDYNAELSRRAQSFGYEHRDCNPNGATVMNAIFRLLSDERRETVEACAADYARGRQMGHAEGFAEGQASMTVRGQEQQLDEARRVIASLRAELEDVKVDRDSADQALDRERARTPETVTTVLL